VEENEDDGGENTTKLIDAINSQNLINGFAYYYWEPELLYKLDSKTSTTLLMYFYYSEGSREFS
jgi:hypothetical protein